MTPIRIVTDSTARFTTRGFLERYPVSVVPLTVRRGTYTVVETEQMDRGATDPLFSSRDSLPIAEPPSQETIAQVYSILRDETDQILSLHTSPQINPVISNAISASQRFLGRCDIQVIDSQTFSVGLGLLVQAAAETAIEGADFETLIRVVRGMIPRLYMIFAVDDMAYLEHNGLVNRSQAILGNMLGIIALLTIEDGKIIPMEKVRTRTRAMEKMIEFASEFASVDHIAILHNDGYNTDECRILKDRMHSLYRGVPITITEYGPSVSTYVGPRSIGVVVLESEEEV
ncbi:MAG: DegV family EDD domain-containing protein [Anaerolineales bacterium]|nr:DegV family EDD domain-containing protein [Anaerolineales bacterium]